MQSMRAAPANWAERLLTPFRTAGEWLFGAPAMALRATEALVGDEGRPVIRVDPGALDFIGVESGGTVVVTWGTRSVHARVLLQSELTRARMEEQFSETTGQQVRASTPSAHVESRLRTPAHLRVWVSPTVRQALNIPSDTVVRVRRSVPHLLVMNSSRLALSIAALIVGGLAVPNVHFGLWLVLSAALLMLTLAPLRLRHTRTGQSRAYRRSSRD
ncbi:hypothetical protein ASG06_05910 [Rathayibacter sp. Leaf185]|nr:hypothetical protein ASF42_05900 [Rathayibacter sp. Leaf294]KQS13916.1 hypothetical protein ASG06_05910 [Rathayibacter sp. Leaf185]